MNPSKILLVEDDESLLDIAQHHLVTAGYSVSCHRSGVEAWNHFSSWLPDLVLTDLILEGSMNGNDLLKKIQGSFHKPPVILMTANGSIQSAVECVQMGAWNYLTKPFHWEDMLSQIQKALAFYDLRQENLRLQSLVENYTNFEGLIGNSSAMVKVKKQMHRLANSEAPVLIQGESGTGKELVARCLHLNGSRKNEAFVTVNCGAIVKDLAESELFGHVKGAFTGAFQNTKGHFQEAHGGTLFLDEIGELPLHLQVKLLRVLQENEVTPVGQSKAIPVNVRLITASNVDLQDAVSHGDFREDLFYRISVLPIHLPPLRDRHGDLQEFIRYFLNKEGRGEVRVSEGLMNKLKNHTWPGNIRELENFVTRLSVMNPELHCFEEEHMVDGPWAQQTELPALSYDIPEEGFDLELHMRRLIESALHRCQGNQTHAAKMLSITRSTLIYRMQKFGLETV